MTNGTLADVDVVATGVQFDLSTLSYGDLRRLQRMDATTPDGMAVLDAVLEKAVVGGLDAIPILKVKDVVVELMALVGEQMSGKNDSAAPS